MSMYSTAMSNIIDITCNSGASEVNSTQRNGGSSQYNPDHRTQPSLHNIIQRMQNTSQIAAEEDTGPPLYYLNNSLRADHII